MKKTSHPTVRVETPKKVTAIVGYSKKELPEIAKKTVKRNLRK